MSSDPVEEPVLEEPFVIEQHGRGQTALRLWAGDLLRVRGKRKQSGKKREGTGHGASPEAYAHWLSQFHYVGMRATFALWV